MKPRRYENMQERIIANSVLHPSGCWVWMRKTRRNNVGMSYGALTVRDGRRVRNVPAHRASVIAFGRRLTRNLVVRHLCNNTLCVNPAHLAGGLQSTNVRQCVAEGRHFTPFRAAA